jgi:hypothetical protein
MILVPFLFLIGLGLGIPAYGQQTSWKNLLQGFGVRLAIASCLGGNTIGFYNTHAQIIKICDDLDTRLESITIAHETVHVLQLLAGQRMIAPLLDEQTLSTLQSKILDRAVLDGYTADQYWYEMEAHFLDNNYQFVYEMASDFSINKSSILIHLQKITSVINEADTIVLADSFFLPGGGVNCWPNIIFG